MPAKGEEAGEQPVAAQAAGLRRIWLCADDYGISPAVDTAIRDLIMRGRINATSVMVVTPSFNRSEALSLKILNSGGRRAAIGLHLTLTGPFRPLTKDFAPLRDGGFLPLNDMIRAAFLRKLRRPTLEGEVKAQLVAFAAAFGGPPDFVDGHQHIHLMPQVRRAVLMAVKEQAPQAWVRQCGGVWPPWRRSFNAKTFVLDILSLGFAARARALGLATNPAFSGAYDFRPDADFAALFPRFLAELPDGGVMMCHPGVVDSELERVDPLTTLREHEYAYLLDEAFPRILAGHGVALA